MGHDSAPMHLRQGAATAQTIDDAQRLPAMCKTRLSKEDSVVNLFRPLASGSATPVDSDTGELNDVRSVDGSVHARIRRKSTDFQMESKGFVHTPKVSQHDIKQGLNFLAIPREPVPLATYLEQAVPAFIQDSTRVACVRQIGHMTGSLPNYLPPLAELVTAMNQNVVKSETSKTVTLLEKQVTASIHRLIYNCSDSFYETGVADPDVALGMFTSGGTIANITGLWAARNAALGPDEAGGFPGVEQRGLLEAALHYGYKGAVVVGSDLMHYSFKKATDVLGIGVQGLVTVDHDEQYRIRVDQVAQKLQECKDRNICVLAVVGIAGATETGAIDDLDALANLAEEHGVHFHVDAAWGGPALFSADLAPMMKGIERADSVTIDGHKQLFMPMGCGMLLLKDPNLSNHISKTASYIIRSGSNDLGRFTLEGSRPANAVYLHANLSCIGASGYEALMNRSVRVCRYMAHVLKTFGSFEVLFEPMTNILLYRYVPAHLRARVFSGAELTDEEWECVDQANASLQEQQKSEGQTFVSRTSINDAKHGGRRLIALRVVIANPLTEERDIDAVIADQLRIADGVHPEEIEKPEMDGSAAEPVKEEYWMEYWRKMPQAAKLFFMDDSARFRATLIAPSAASALE